MAKAIGPSPQGRGTAVKVSADKSRDHGRAKSAREPYNREWADGAKGKPKVSRHGSLSDSEQWALLPGSSGYRVHIPSGYDEDFDGRSEIERMVERGVKDAGNDQIRQATREGELD